MEGFMASKKFVGINLEGCIRDIVWDDVPLGQVERIITLAEIPEDKGRRDNLIADICLTVCPTKMADGKSVMSDLLRANLILHVGLDKWRKLTALAEGNWISSEVAEQIMAWWRKPRLRASEAGALSFYKLKDYLFDHWSALVWYALYIISILYPLQTLTEFILYDKLF